MFCYHSFEIVVITQRVVEQIGGEVDKLYHSV